MSQKRRAIERKGMPCLRKWRFITLTLNPDLFEDCPVAGYLEGKAHMRRFLDKCRKAGLWAVATPWAWKMEFQANGWVHWHLLVGRTGKMCEDDFDTLTRLWGLGRVNVEMVRQDSFAYSFKYAFKTVRQALDEGDNEEAEQWAPAWFLDYVGRETVNVKWKDADGIQRSERQGKPKGLSRVRFWQTSKGFYTGPIEETLPAKDPVSCVVPWTARAVAERARRSLVVCARDISGHYLKSSVFTLKETAGRFFDYVGWHTVNGGAVGLGVNSFAVPAFIIEQRICQTWKLPALLQENRLTVRAAEKLQRERRSLQTC